MKKSISFILVMLMVLCMVPGVALAAEVIDTWDGTVDTSWYNNTDTEFTLTTAEQLAGLAELVDGGNSFAGKTIKLGNCLDLYVTDSSDNKISFNPIGHSANGKSFNGTFDGQGHTISNMYQQSNLDSSNGGWKYEGEYYGLFAYTNGATIKNLTVADAYISSGRNEAAGVVGNAVDTTFSDITISKTTLIGYNNSVGGVAAECYGNCSFTNITVDKDTVIGPLWGTYDVRLGGVVGLVQSGNNVTLKNVKVACKIDAINDVAANYQYWLYRYCGMLIGHVDGVDGVANPTGYVTCENVTVTYCDWRFYHYCEYADLGAGSYNGPGEYKYARVEAGTGTGGIDLSACNHNADESHNVLIEFDQLFGGGQGVKGLKTYNGVTVKYDCSGTGDPTPGCECESAGESNPSASPEITPTPKPTEKPASSGIKVEYEGGNSFSTSKSDVPTGVEIDGVPVTFNGTGSNFTVGCISSDAKWVTVRWNSTSVTTNFTPDGNVVCTEVIIPKTGDVSFWTAITQFFGF